MEAIVLDEASVWIISHRASVKRATIGFYCLRVQYMCVCVCERVHVCMRPHWPLLVNQTLHQCVWQTDRYYINLHSPYCDVLFIMKMIDALAWINVCRKHLLWNMGCVGVLRCVGVRWWGKEKKREKGMWPWQITDMTAPKHLHCIVDIMCVMWWGTYETGN